VGGWVQAAAQALPLRRATTVSMASRAPPALPLLALAQTKPPRQVDITTEETDPVTNQPIELQDRGTRVAIGGSCDDWYGSGAGGVAYVGVFGVSTRRGGGHWAAVAGAVGPWQARSGAGAPAGRRRGPRSPLFPLLSTSPLTLTPCPPPKDPYYMPAFIFPDDLGGGRSKYVVEAISHEVRGEGWRPLAGAHRPAAPSSRHPYALATARPAAGLTGPPLARAPQVGHNLGLSHDGAGSDPYYSGHADWAPIMGVGEPRGALMRGPRARRRAGRCETQLSATSGGATHAPPPRLCCARLPL
jgi:hypothetical protein